MDGFVNLLKPPGMTSAAVVATLRRLCAGEKAGHAGTLDPEAAGVLPVMMGRLSVREKLSSTKLSAPVVL